MLLVLLLSLASLSAASTKVQCHLAWSTMRDEWVNYRSLPSEINHKLPVIMTRTPYNHSITADGPVVSNCDSVKLKKLAARGYAVLNQDVRGTARSEGVMNAIHQEAQDGYDAVEWAAVQPWSNGKVGLTGASYAGVTALQAATQQPPHLVAVSAAITGSNYQDTWTYVNGAFNLWFSQSWLMLSFAADTYRRELEANGHSTKEAEKKTVHWVREGHKNILPVWTKQRPLMAFLNLKR